MNLRLEQGMSKAISKQQTRAIFKNEKKIWKAAILWYYEIQLFLYIHFMMNYIII
ncbi:hypothetical protein [Treponema pectinovorum]|uniref:hypothetical protein n=1 Tax=Treponema pectinovorum TaxID=164 RepID=UPI00164D5F0D|nr:hypothetical protein [Treponema pectinovorum]